MFKKILSILVLVISAIAQTGSFIVNIGGKIININILPTSTVTYSISNGAADANGNVVLNISTSTSRRPAAGEQVDILYTPADVTSISASNGPTATAAVKNTQCAAPPNTTGVYRCIVSGGNTSIGNGVVLSVALVVNKATQISLMSPVSSTPQGSALISSIAAGGGTIVVAVAVQSVSCTTPAYDSGLPANTYNLESGEGLNCIVALNQAAPAGGFAITPVLTGMGATVSSVSVPAGQTSSTFTITGN